MSIHLVSLEQHSFPTYQSLAERRLSFPTFLHRITAVETPLTLHREPERQVPALTAVKGDGCHRPVLEVWRFSFSERQSCCVPPHFPIIAVSVSHVRRGRISCHSHPKRHLRGIRGAVAKDGMKPLRWKALYHFIWVQGFEEPLLSLADVQEEALSGKLF